MQTTEHFKIYTEKQNLIKNFILHIEEDHDSDYIGLTQDFKNEKIQFDQTIKTLEIISQKNKDSLSKAFTLKLEDQYVYFKATKDYIEKENLNTQKIIDALNSIKTDLESPETEDMTKTQKINGFKLSLNLLKDESQDIYQNFEKSLQGLEESRPRSNAIYKGPILDKFIKKDNKDKFANMPTEQDLEDKLKDNQPSIYENGQTFNKTFSANKISSTPILDQLARDHEQKKAADKSLAGWKYINDLPTETSEAEKDAAEKEATARQEQAASDREKAEREEQENAEKAAADREKAEREIVETPAMKDKVLKELFGLCEKGGAETTLIPAPTSESLDQYQIYKNLINPHIKNDKVDFKKFADETFKDAKPIKLEFKEPAEENKLKNLYKSASVPIPGSNQDLFKINLNKDGTFGIQVNDINKLRKYNIKISLPIKSIKEKIEILMIDGKMILQNPKLSDIQLDKDNKPYIKTGITGFRKEVFIGFSATAFEQIKKATSYAQEAHGSVENNTRAHGYTQGCLYTMEQETKNQKVNQETLKGELKGINNHPMIGPRTQDPNHQHHSNSYNKSASTPPLALDEISHDDISQHGLTFFSLDDIDKSSSTFLSAHVV